MKMRAWFSITSTTRDQNSGRVTAPMAGVHDVDALNDFEVNSLILFLRSERV